MVIPYLRASYDQWQSHLPWMPFLDHRGNLGNKLRLSDKCLQGKHEKINSSLLSRTMVMVLQASKTNPQGHWVQQVKLVFSCAITSLQVRIGSHVEVLVQK